MGTKWKFGRCTIVPRTLKLSLPVLAELHGGNWYCESSRPSLSISNSYILHLLNFVKMSQNTFYRLQWCHGLIQKYFHSDFRDFVFSGNWNKPPRLLEASVRIFFEIFVIVLIAMSQHLNGACSLFFQDPSRFVELKWSVFSFHSRSMHLNAYEKITAFNWLPATGRFSCQTLRKFRRSVAKFQRLARVALSSADWEDALEHW